MAGRKQPRGDAAGGQHQQSNRSEAQQRVQQYMLANEEISYSLRFRPTGFVHWIKSLFGFGVTHWFVTNQRLVEQTRIGGGFVFKDIPHGKMSSIEYGSRVPLSVVALGILVGLTSAAILVYGPSDVQQFGAAGILLSAGLIAYAYWRQRQVLRVTASGGVTLALDISKGDNVDDLLWYLHAERNKRR